MCIQSQEISSILSENPLDAGTSNSLPSSTTSSVLNHTPSHHHVHGFSHHPPALTPHSILNTEPSSLAKQLQVCTPQFGSTLLVVNLYFSLHHSTPPPLHQAHRQTIDVLVGEKTALQSELSSAQTQLINKSSVYHQCHVTKKFVVLSFLPSSFPLFLSPSLFPFLLSSLL